MKFCLAIVLSQASDTNHLLFASERIYAVLGIVLIVFSGFIVMLVRNERKLARLEQEWRQTEKS